MEEFYLKLVADIPILNLELKIQWKQNLRLPLLPNSLQRLQFFLSPEELEKYTGTYLPSKIHIEQKNGKLYLVRVNQNIHIELYCVDKDSFKRRYEEQQTIYKLISEGDRKPSVWGYGLITKQFV